MNLIDPKTGKPVTSERKVLLAITIVDQRPGEQGQPHQLAYVLEDEDDRADVGRLLSTMSRSALTKLDELGVFDESEDDEPDIVTPAQRAEPTIQQIDPDESKENPD